VSIYIIYKILYLTSTRKELYNNNNNT